MSEVTERLRQANERLRSLVDWVSSGNADQIAAAGGHLTDLSAELANVGELLGKFRMADHQCHKELSEYRQNLVRLRAALPVFQAQLLAVRSRLEPERAHVQAAAAWIAGSKSTV